MHVLGKCNTNIPILLYDVSGWHAVAQGFDRLCWRITLVFVKHTILYIPKVEGTGRSLCKHCLDCYTPLPSAEERTQICHAA